MKETVLGINVNTEGYDELMELAFERIEKKAKGACRCHQPRKNH